MNPWKIQPHSPHCQEKKTYTFPRDMKWRRGIGDPQDCPPELNFCLELKLLTDPKHTFHSTVLNILSYRYVWLLWQLHAARNTAFLHKNTLNFRLKKCFDPTPAGQSCISLSWQSQCTGIPALWQTGSSANPRLPGGTKEQQFHTQHPLPRQGQHKCIPVMHSSLSVQHHSSRCSAVTSLSPPAAPKQGPESHFHPFGLPTHNIHKPLPPLPAGCSKETRDWAACLWYFHKKAVAHFSKIKTQKGT